MPAPGVAVPVILYVTLIVLPVLFVLFNETVNSPLSVGVSFPVASLALIVTEATSSSVIVPVADGVFNDTPVGRPEADKVISTDSVDSKFVSSITGTEIVALEAPLGITTEVVEFV